MAGRFMCQTKQAKGEIGKGGGRWCSEEGKRVSQEKLHGHVTSWVTGQVGL